MSRLFNRLPSKNTIIWHPPVITKSPCRSPRSRFNSSSSNSTKTRRLWHNTNNNYPRPPVKRPSLPYHCLSPMRRDYNRLHLSTTNGPQIPNRLLIRKSHRLGSRRHFNPNTMRFYRSFSTNNCPRPSILCLILPS